MPLYEDGLIIIIFTLFPQNYVVGGSKTGVFSRKRRTSRHSVKIEGWFRCSVLTKKKICSYYEQFTESVKYVK